MIALDLKLRNLQNNWNDNILHLELNLERTWWVIDWKFQPNFVWDQIAEPLFVVIIWFEYVDI